MFDFIKKMFGGGSETSAPQPEVKESDLDRFLLYAPNFMYYDNRGNGVFQMVNGKQNMVNDHIEEGMIALVVIMWLRRTAKVNRELYQTLTNQYSANSNPSDSEMKKFLMNYFHTGGSLRQPNLTTFYKRGAGIVKIIDSMQGYFHIIIKDSTNSAISYANSKFGPTDSLKLSNVIFNEDLAKIISRDANTGLLKS